jgi:hypothetical protein
MLRAAAWTCGLFALGGGVVHFFPGTFTEPLVLLALGAALLVVSGRGRAVPQVESANEPAAVPSARAVR